MLCKTPVKTLYLSKKYTIQFSQNCQLSGTPICNSLSNGNVNGLNHLKNENPYRIITYQETNLKFLVDLVSDILNVIMVSESEIDETMENHNLYHWKIFRTLPSWPYSKWWRDSLTCKKKTFLPNTSKQLESLTHWVFS